MPSRPLGIVHVVRAPIGGIFRHIADLARAQTAAGHRVGIVCDSRSGGAFEDVSRRAGVAIPHGKALGVAAADHDRDGQVHLAPTVLATMPGAPPQAGPFDRAAEFRLAAEGDLHVAGLPRVHVTVTPPS